MNEDGVAGLGFFHTNGRPIATAFAVVSSLEADKTWLNLWAFMIGWIDMEDASTCVGFGFSASCNRDALLCIAGDSIGITKRELALVTCGWFEIEDAASEALGDGVSHALALAEDVLAADAQEGKGGTPGGSTNLSESDFDGGIAVGIALD